MKVAGPKTMCVVLFIAAKKKKERERESTRRILSARDTAENNKTENLLS